MILEPIEVYHANTAYSHSKLETFRRRPALYFKKFVERSIPPPEITTAFRIGSAAHALILEPATFNDRYIERPEGIDRRTKEGKQAWAEFETKAGSRTIIDQDDIKLVGSMQDSVINHPLASQLLSAGTPELTWRTTGDIKLQCRTDWFNPQGCELSDGRPYVADIKTVESLDADAFRNFERSVFQFGYHRQAGFYLPLITELLGKTVHDFFFIAIEKVEPFGAAVFRLSDEAVALGRDETVSDLKRLIECVRESRWPNIDPALQHLGIPKWYKHQ